MTQKRTQRKDCLRLVVVIACITGTGQIATAGDAVVPFRATFSGTAFFASATKVMFQGVGEATHLGLSANAGDLTLSAPEANGCIPNINIETLTAANGDQLVLVMEDIACPVAPGIFQGTGEWHVFSGTGRFANATGTGTVAGGANFNLSMFEITMTGEISY